ncbi:MAG: hypothetical protein AB7V77_03415 [Candidatus Woesearchaeota archaeon]
MELNLRLDLVKSSDEEKYKETMRDLANIMFDFSIDYKNKEYISEIKLKSKNLQKSRERIEEILQEQEINFDCITFKPKSIKISGIIETMRYSIQIYPTKITTKIPEQIHLQNAKTLAYSINKFFLERKYSK